MSTHNQLPIVSVVIPVYNNEKYIKSCVDSLTSQTYPLDHIEILLVDDGSTDCSLEVCYEIQKKYPQIKVISKENGGVSQTRNVGMGQAQGKYIILLDSDDYISSKTIKNLVSFFEKHYDEIDLVTYPIYWYYESTETLKEHPRYKSYTEGTGVYNLDEFPQVNQSTVNIMIKNDKENPHYYNQNMKLSEDQFFNTEILMQKNKIGFVKEAIYYYRRHGGGASQTRNNPYYCFEDIMSYNELLISKYQKNGIVPLYIQYLVGNTIKWRVGANELFPYHYSGEKYDQSVKRIVRLLEHVDDEVIMNLEACDIHRKIYLLKLKGKKLKLETSSNSYSIITEDGFLVENNEYVECVLTRVKGQEKNKVFINAYLKSAIPLLTNQIKVIINLTMRDGSKKEVVPELRESIYSYTPSGLKFANFLNFDLKLDMMYVKEVQILVDVEGNKYPIRYIFIKNSRFQVSNYRYHIYINDYRLSIDKKKRRILKIKPENPLIKMYDIFADCMRYGLKNPKILYFRSLAKTDRKIWLYVDSHNIIDNSYYQFKHDLYKDDGIERYYIYDGDLSFYQDKFNDHEKKYLIKHKSKKHKELFLKSDKIFVSFSSLSIYQPFKSMRKYQDVLHYDLIYLQHGILHANLLRMYSKESTEIDKFVISSHFEKSNLINRYNYREEDLICSTMPRMAVQKEKVQVQNKILFAPSWRKYLIGDLINNRRELRTQEFLESKFYIEINEFLHSKELLNLLEESDMILDFKLHPIFKGYKDLFGLKDDSRIRISFDKTILGEYKMFITDFSSFQFDYVMYSRPIIYFLPDEIEFRAGLHTYSKLDLKYEDAFGKLCLDSHSLIDTMKKYMKNNFVVENIYQERMKNFFFECSDPCEKIYASLIQENK